MKKNEVVETDIEEIMETGDRLPAEMWEPELAETIMVSPIFDGVKIVDEAKE